MKSLACCFAVALFVVQAPPTAPQTPLVDPQAWGANTNGLRMGISSVESGTLPSSGGEFLLALQNTGDSDVVVNLGYMLANGKVMFPTAIRLAITNPDGQTRELQFFDRRYPTLAGRVDDFTVALRNGSVYVLQVSLNQYWSPATKEFDLKLTDGRYRIAARFVGEGARATNLDMQGVALLNFWNGTLQSNVLEFDVSERAASK